MLSIPVLVIVVVVLLVLYTINLNNKKPDNYPPGPPLLPIYGNYWFLLKENFFYPFKACISLCKKYNTDLLGLHIGPYPTVVSHKYHIVKEMLTREEFVGRNDTVIVRNRGRGDLSGIFFVDGPFWKDQRWFSLRHMRDYGFGRRDVPMEDVCADEIRNLIHFLTSKPKPSDKDVCSARGIVRMPDVIYGPAINCIHHTLSSTRYNDFKELINVAKAATKFLNSIDTTGNCISVTPWLRFIAPNYFGWNSSITDTEVVFAFARKVIQQHKDTYIKNHPRDFIDVYLDEMNYLNESGQVNTSFSDKQLIYTVTDYTFPSPVGVGHTLNYLFAYLILQPELQDKLHEELDRVVGRARLPTLDDRKNLHYVEATLREIMRKETLVPLSLARRCTKDTTLGGYFIPKDTSIVPNLWGMHNDPEMWGDPENFRPERFLEADGTMTKKDYSLPFGAGKRLCAGETFARNTMFLFIAGIMQNFILKSPAGMEKPNLENQTNGLTLAMPDYWMEVVPRS